MTMPSVVVMPTRRPISLRMWAIIRTVVVLPFVPVTPMIGMRAFEPDREQQVDDRLGHVLRLALGGVGVHPEAGRGVDLHDGAALLPDGHPDVGHDEVDARDVEADHLGRGLGDLDVLRMGLHGPVDGGAARGHVAGQRELDPGARRRAPTSSVEALLGDAAPAAASSSLMRVSTFSWPKPRRGSLFSMSTSSRDGVRAVGRDTRGDPLGDGHHPAADDEHPVVGAVDVASRRPRRRRGSRACAMGNAFRTSVLGAQVEAHAAPVVAVERLDHHRDSRWCVAAVDRVVLGVHRLRAGHRQPGGMRAAGW